MNLRWIYEHYNYWTCCLQADQNIDGGWIALTNKTIEDVSLIPVPKPNPTPLSDVPVMHSLTLEQTHTDTYARECQRTYGIMFET